jgi:hypothetical protein
MYQYYGYSGESAGNIYSPLAKVSYVNAGMQTKNISGTSNNDNKRAFDELACIECEGKNELHATCNMGTVPRKPSGGISMRSACLKDHLSIVYGTEFGV